MTSDDSVTCACFAVPRLRLDEDSTGTKLVFWKFCVRADILFQAFNCVQAKETFPKICVWFRTRTQAL